MSETKSSTPQPSACPTSSDKTQQSLPCDSKCPLEVLDAIRKRVAEEGRHMSDEDINAEIEAYRKERDGV